MTTARWKSGTCVQLISDGSTMIVVGYDSVGSVICERPRGGRLLRGYFSPAVLTAMDNTEASKALTGPSSTTSG